MGNKNLYSLKEQLYYVECYLKGRTYQCLKRIPNYGKNIRHNHYGNREVLAIQDGRNILREAIFGGGVIYGRPLRH